MFVCVCARVPVTRANDKCVREQCTLYMCVYIHMYSYKYVFSCIYAVIRIHAEPVRAHGYPAYISISLYMHMYANVCACSRRFPPNCGASRAHEAQSVGVCMYV